MRHTGYRPFAIEVGLSRCRRLHTLDRHAISHQSEAVLVGYAFDRNGLLSGHKVCAKDIIVNGCGGRVRGVNSAHRIGRADLA